MKRWKGLTLADLTGFFMLGYWGLDLANNLLFVQKPLWILWYSSMGLVLTSLALIKKNAFLLNSMFCALFAIESVWNIGFFSLLLFNKSFYGVTAYAFAPNFPLRDFIVTSYHIFIPIGLFVGLIRDKIVYTNAWLGASLYALVLLLSTLLLAKSGDMVNCVYSLNFCISFVSFLSDVSVPLRILIGLFLLISVVYIPTNYILLAVADLLGWRMEKGAVFRLQNQTARESRKEMSPSKIEETRAG